MRGFVRCLSGCSRLPRALWILSGALLMCCNWEPIARPARPKRVLADPARIDHALDGQGKYVLVEAGPKDATHWHIVRSETLTSCELPAGVPGWDVLEAPNLKREDAPEFLLPMLVPAEDGALQLHFADEQCRMGRGYGPAENFPRLLKLRADERHVALVLRPERALELVDPWTEQTRMISESVRGYAVVDQPASTSLNTPEALWLLEGGKLRQRGLDGTLLLSLGNQVTGFEQALIYGMPPLRVVYRDDGDLYEARGPDFTPVLIAEDACEARYVNDTLELFVPCSPPQLVRIELTTGAIRRFAPGVVNAYTLGELEVEAVRADEEEQIWVTPKAGPRRQLVPTPATALTLIGQDLIVGRTGAGQFGVWSLQGQFTPVFDGVVGLTAYRTTRTGQLLWVMMHEVNDSRIGQLSVFEQRDVERMLAGAGPAGVHTIAQGVPVGRYAVVFLGTLEEPLVLTLEDSTVVEYAEAPEGEPPEPVRFAGTLHARLLSNELKSSIDVGVSSFTTVFAPLPGVLYGVTEGSNSGLWFAAL